jgi:hypothetical protein
MSMDDLLDRRINALRDGRRDLDVELRPVLENELPDWSMLERLRDVADDYAARARQLRAMMIEQDADADSLAEMDQLCAYFNGTADLIAQRTGDREE